MSDNRIEAVRQLVAARASELIIQTLGNLSHYASNAVEGANQTTFDESAMLAAIEMIKGAEQENQEMLIRLMATIGFTVLCSPYIEKPMVMLPKAYESAIKSVRQKQESAKPLPDEMVGI